MTNSRYGPAVIGRMPDLRNTVAADDVVVFIAADRLSDQRPARYQLAGWATAERIVSQLDIWQHDELAVYRHYRNLLIRPADDGEGFVHHEAQHPEHPDWLRRLARHTHCGPPKASSMSADGVSRSRQSALLAGGLRALAVAHSP